MMARTRYFSKKLQAHPKPTQKENHGITEDDHIILDDTRKKVMRTMMTPK